MLAPSGTLVLWRIPAFIPLLIHALYLVISACGAVMVGVFKSFVGSVRFILRIILRTGGSSSGTSLPNTLGNIARKSGTSSGFVMADLDSLHFPSQVSQTLYLEKEMLFFWHSMTAPSFMRSSILMRIS